ncbi:hypothetical protein RZS08_38370, partial [Arthrospira platensis SPKY1]|nr:hypothetical protein [Arthrospira platensis SPKY1]
RRGELQFLHFIPLRPPRGGMQETGQAKPERQRGGDGGGEPEAQRSAGMFDRPGAVGANKIRTRHGGAQGLRQEVHGFRKRLHTGPQTGIGREFRLAGGAFGGVQLSEQVGGPPGIFGEGFHAGS